jgi:tetratricopeptide (TPR) repeat protein
MPQHLRIFISSPGDVPDERLRADLVVDKISQDFCRFFTFETYRWEHEPMLASGHFQDAIDPPSSADIVILTLWSRLGTPLPEKTGAREYRGIDGRTPVTGTEWEYEDALQSARDKGAPDILAFRNVSPATIDTRDQALREKSLRQLDALDVFWKRHFADRGVFLAAYDEYQSIEEFSVRLEESLRKLIERRIAALTGTSAQGPIWSGAPFRGLQPYEFEHAGIFFGRDELVAKAAEQLAAGARAGTAFLLITGASGSGKSSLVKAALVPRLMKPQRIQGVAFLRRAIYRPADGQGDVILGLVEALTRIGHDGDGLPEMLAPGQSASQLAAHLRAAAEGPGFVFSSALGRLTEEGRRAGLLLDFEQARLIMVIDQLEELFTNSAIGVDDRNLFIRLIGNLARSQAVWVIATLRADFWHRAAEVPDLLALAQGSGRLDILAPSLAELAEMIRKPAQAAGLSFEINSESGLGLDAVLAEDAANEPGALPLLSFTLDSLYGKDVVKDGRRDLTFATYRSLGGLEGAIATRADEIVAGLADAAKAAVPRVVRALATISSDADQTVVARVAPLTDFPDGSPARQAVDALTAARLLVASNENATATVRLAHEALISHWQRAREQLLADRRDLQTRALVERQRVRWNYATSGRQKQQLLLRDPDLASAIDLAGRWGDELNPAIRNFILKSRQRSRLMQQLTAMAAVLFALVAVAAIYGLVQVQQERARAETNFEKALLTANDLAAANQSSAQGDFANALGQARAAEKTMSELTKQSPSASAFVALADSKTTVGDLLMNQGKLADAFDEFRASLSIREQIVAAHPEKVEILGIGHGRLGYLYKREGKWAEALKEFRNALGIREQLVTEGKGDAITYRNIVIGHRDSGDMLESSGDTKAAQAEYRTALARANDFSKEKLAGNLLLQWDIAALHERLGRYYLNSREFDNAFSEFQTALDTMRPVAMNDPGSVQKQHDMALFEGEVGDALVRKGKNTEGAAHYTASFAVLSAPSMKRTWAANSSLLGGLALSLILARDFSKALEVAEFAIAAAPGDTWLRSGRAAALMFLNQTDEARAEYMGHRGERAQNEKTWETLVSAEFEQFRTAGLTNPLMDDVEKQFVGKD